MQKKPVGAQKSDRPPEFEWTTYPASRKVNPFDQDLR